MKIPDSEDVSMTFVSPRAATLKEGITDFVAFVEYSLFTFAAKPVFAVEGALGSAPQSVF